LNVEPVAWVDFQSTNCTSLTALLVEEEPSPLEENLSTKTETVELELMVQDAVDIAVELVVDIVGDIAVYVAVEFLAEVVVEAVVKDIAVDYFALELVEDIAVAEDTAVAGDTAAQTWPASILRQTSKLSSRCVS